MDAINLGSNKGKEESFTNAEKVVSLYKFIHDLSALKQKMVLNVKDYNWYQPIRHIHNDPQNIELFYRDRVEEESTDTIAALIRVHKPEFHRCPEPDPILSEWLNEGWTQFQNEVKVREMIERNSGKVQALISKLKKVDEPESLIEQEINDEDEKADVIIERFTDDERRVKALEKWIPVRDEWVEKQKIFDKTRSLFTRLYQLHVDIERESETLEMVITAGFLRDRENWDINHPVLTRRVKTRFDAINNMMIIEDTDIETELYAMLFQVMTEINLDSITSLRDDLRKNDYHPMDRNDTPEFLKVLVHQLSPESVFSKNDEPTEWYKNNRLLLSMNPSFLVRKKVDGTLKAVEQIIENIEETGYVPPHIGDIVNGGKIDIPNDDHEETVEEQLAAVGGESVDILLSKEANKEQLEIAQRIENYNAVLVQGPPGTGKTHTIANLMGHFLAQGKSVLVTSHTKKALTVLKEKVAPGLQNLCVSVLDDSNVDMEKSVDGITTYIGKHTSHELKKQTDATAQERRHVIADLAETRKKLFTIINREYNSIVLNGEEISPSKAAVFVLDHAEDLSYIPGKVRLYSPLPASFEELADLYRSNEGITAADEPELACDLPEPAQLLSPAGYEKRWQSLQNEKAHVDAIASGNNWKIRYDTNMGITFFETDLGKFNVVDPAEKDLNALNNYIESFGRIEPWMRYAAVDGKKGGSYRQKWITLIKQIEKTCKYAESVVMEQFGKEIVFADGTSADELAPIFDKLRAIFEKKSKITKFDLMFNSSIEKGLTAVTINGLQIQSANDCDIVLHIFELADIRKLCAKYWDDLLSEHDVPHFMELDTYDPERIAEKWIPLIQRYLDWYQQEYSFLADKLSVAQIPTEIVFPANALDSELAATDRILSAIGNTISPVVDVCKTVIRIRQLEEDIDTYICKLHEEKRVNSAVCSEIVQAMSSGNCAAYAETYKRLEMLYTKYDLKQKREELLKKIALVAPQWADAITDRVGIHGEFTVPSTIEDAWKWKQYSGIITEIASGPYDELQAESLRLSKRYREITASYAEKSAWYHLLSRTERDIDMKQALQGWKLTVQRIGKGTGKNAPMYKAQARKLMAKCQMAVPAWIMPVSKALESLDPRKNRFDIIIIDEASQSDITALAIAYMAKKLIIVGDDKQVSPMAVGIEVDKMNSLIQMYIKDKIPNSHLYNAKTSLYEIALTTYQPLMLREHFRCVPEIIGFSNALSYDYKIKPLRDASNSVILPAVVNYRVADGERIGKENMAEVKSIVALIKACIEQPEYKGKTFGVISLLGDEQAKKIQSLIFEYIDAKDIENRRILCGNASNFQGDERNIIFLSIVDSNVKNGPLPMQGFGPDDSFRKRYNVATSRAKDQLWVVDSLDTANDLKPGDIRKRLIDYSLNPVAYESLAEEIEEKSDSFFEAAVAKALVDRGYHLIQQWKVGAYRLDMVAVCGRRYIAIECDGDRYHSGETKIREDMERQTILERLGWRFVRIRGSEYFRNPDKTIERVITELSDHGIAPEDQVNVITDTRTSELLERTKARAFEILQSFNASKDGEVDIETISVALDPKTIIPFIPNSSFQQSQTAPVQLIANPVEKSMVQTKEPQAQIKPRVELKIQQATREDVLLAKNPYPVRPDEPRSESPILKQPTFDDSFKGKAANDVISMIKMAGIEYIDKRAHQGALWIIGGRELDSFVSQCRKIDVQFIFKAGGGKATKNRDAWWAK